MKRKTKKELIDINVFRKAGKKGGKKTAERGSDFYSEIGKRGNEKRWRENKDQNMPTA